ncbi:hypothetical protein LVB87_12575 [Lysobacter sp. KIS68-7]|uniref:hypothetical protein n=1 Tax=Lysobacter sp. KIS68-7 TaxID=2904252 RepID=UPI001E504481|nr:hypothetical protein [Lysobacter sp. KIS68-7]UHQ19010.1 hypothetical protein LVB87_12575 [Lysobacter sp. KIS68-7]
MTSDDFPEPFAKVLSLFSPSVLIAEDAMTFYDAVDLTARLNEPDRSNVIHRWVLVALMRAPRTREMLMEVACTDMEWLYLAISMMRPVKSAIEAMPRRKPTPNNRAGDTKARKMIASPKRAFEQLRNRVVRMLRVLKKDKLVTNHQPGLAELLRSAGFVDYADAVKSVDLQRSLKEFELLRQMQQRGQSLSEYVRIDGPACIEIPRPAYPHPTVIDLLAALERHFAEAEGAPVSKHEPRGQFLREIYGVFARTVIADRRRAFLSHVSDAVFAEPIDKADIRTLVMDLRDQERQMGSMVAREEGDIAA